MSDLAATADIKGVTTYRGENRGVRFGFRLEGEQFDSAPIYNDEIHVRLGALKHIGARDRDGKPISGSNISLNRRGVLGRRALRRLREAGIQADTYVAGARL